MRHIWTWSLPLYGQARFRQVEREGEHCRKSKDQVEKHETFLRPVCCFKSSKRSRQEGGKRSIIYLLKGKREGAGKGRVSLQTNAGLTLVKDEVSKGGLERRDSRDSAGLRKNLARLMVQVGAKALTPVSLVLLAFGRK